MPNCQVFDSQGKCTECKSDYIIFTDGLNTRCLYSNNANNYEVPDIYVVNEKYHLTFSGCVGPHYLQSNEPKYSPNSCFKIIEDAYCENIPLTNILTSCKLHPNA